RRHRAPRVPRRRRAPVRHRRRRAHALLRDVAPPGRRRGGRAACRGGTEGTAMKVLRLMLSLLVCVPGFALLGVMAEAARGPFRSLQNYEQGHRAVPLRAAARLADALGVSLDELAGRGPPKKKGGK